MSASMTSATAPPAAGAPAPSDGMLDLGALWQAVYAHRAWVLVPTLIALVASFLAVHLVTPRYTGEARVFLENRDSFFTRPVGDREVAGDRFDTEAVQSQVQIMMSRDLAREVVRRLGLVGNPEFDKGAGLFSVFDRLLTTVGLLRHPADRTPEDRVLETYYDQLLIFPVARSRIVAIEFQSRDAELAARAANMIATVYMEFQEAAKKDTARGASSWLAGAIEPLRQKVQEAEAKVEAFRARSGLLVGTNNTTIIQSELADLSQRMSAARSAQADSQARARLIREAIRNGRTFEIPDVANNDLIRRLIEQRVNLRAQIALESRTLLPEHPRIKELTAQINDLEQQIRAAAERTVRTLENEAQINGSRVEAIAATMEAQKRAVATANESEVELRALEREARTQREQLEQFLSRYRDAVSRDAQNAAPADARVISRAITPLTPSFPKKVPTIAVVTMATFFVALALVVSRELLSGRALAAPVAPAQPVAQPLAPGPGAEPARRAQRFGGGFRARATRTQDAPAIGEDEAGPFGPDGAQDADTGAETEAGGDADARAPGTSAGESTARRARVAGLLTHAGRITHLALDADDSTLWREQVLGPDTARPAGGLVLLAVDAGTRPGAVRVLAQELAEEMRTALVDLASPERRRAVGLSELLAGEASFADIIEADRESLLHLIGPGLAGRDAVLAAPDLLALALEALADVYDLVVLESASTDPQAIVSHLMARCDSSLVIADHLANGHAVETSYKLAQGHDKPVAMAMFAVQPAPLMETGPLAEPLRV